MTTEPPSTRLPTLKDWSRNFNWQERARAYDAAWEEHKNEERRAVMEVGLALDYERVRKLVRLADFLEGQLYEQGEDGIYHNVWLPDVKSIGGGEHAERVDIERFNAPLIEQFRKTLDDLAKEVGGRIAKQDVTSGGEPLREIVIRYKDHDGK